MVKKKMKKKRKKPRKVPLFPSVMRRRVYMGANLKPRPFQI
jgi:hypothetical protein